MATFDAGYYLVGGWSDQSGDHSVELYEYSPGGEFDEWPVEQKDLRVKNQIITTGKDNEPFATHLRGELQLNIIDEDNHFRNRFRAATTGQFYLTSSDPDLEFFGFPVTDFIGGQFWKQYNVRTFVFGDGITTLKSSSNTYTSYVQLGEFLYSALQETGVAATVNFVMDFQHVDAAGQDDIIPNQIRINPADFVANYTDATLYDAILEVLKNFRLQIWQENGEWWVAQRSVRLSSATLYTRNTSGWTTSTHNPEVEVPRFALRSAESSDIQFSAVKSFTRQVSQTSHEFETLNPQFDDWTDGAPDDWSVDGDVTEVYNGLSFDDDSAVVSQVLLRPLKLEDVLHLKLAATYNLLDAGPLMDGDYTFGVAQVRLVQPTPADGDTYYLAADGSWSTTEGYIEDTLTVASGVYTNASDLDLDLDLDELPQSFEGWLEIELSITGNDVYKSVDPIVYTHVEFTSVELADEVTSLDYVIVAGNALASGDVESDSIHLYDSKLISAYPTIQYYDGTEWQRAVDWDGDVIARQAIHQIVITDYLSQRTNNLNGYQLQVAQFIQLSDAITLPDFEEGVTFIPYWVQRSKKDRRTLVQVAALEINDPDAETTLDYT